MKMHYRVRSVLLTADGAALTLSPVTWVRDSPTETMTDDLTGETFPAWEDCEPTDEGAEPQDDGGKMTELRVVGDPGWKPRDLLTVTVEPSRP